MSTETQRGGAAAWLLWMVVVMTALVMLAALGVWHAMEALDRLGPLRVMIDGRDVLNGVRWSDFHDGERISFVLLVGFALLLIGFALLLGLLLVLPLVFIGALVIPLVVTVVVVAVSLAPIVLPVLLIVWLVRRSRRATGAAITP